MKNDKNLYSQNDYNVDNNINNNYNLNNNINNKIYRNNNEDTLIKKNSLNNKTNVNVNIELDNDYSKKVSYLKSNNSDKNIIINIRSSKNAQNSLNSQLHFQIFY